jgi:hypothetical protein
MKKPYKHDSNICFRCRLYDLFEELKDKNEKQFMVTALAEALGQVLSDENPINVMTMLQYLISVINGEQNGDNKVEEHTKH